MKCLRCLKHVKEDDSYRPKIVNKYLKHLNDWYLCIMFKEMEDEVNKIDARIYYNKNKKHYRDLHKKYKRTLVDSYVANAFVDRTDLKAVDVPKSMIKAKRGFMLFNRIIKAQEESENGNKSKKK